jgi:hypothetical protein
VSVAFAGAWSVRSSDFRALPRLATQKRRDVLLGGPLRWLSCGPEAGQDRPSKFLRPGELGPVAGRKVKLINSADLGPAGPVDVPHTLDTAWSCIHCGMGNRAAPGMPDEHDMAVRRV